VFEREETGKTYYFLERQLGPFYRSFRLRKDADVENITVNFVDSILLIKIAKRSSKMLKLKKIEVRKN
jgi:HSP20 family molecular chaperone IbpA